MTLQRRVSLRKKSAKPRRRLAGCPIKRCKRYPYRRGECDNLCVVHLRRALDRMARAKCLEKYGFVCFAGQPHLPFGPCSADCGTPSVQWAHIVRRGRGLTRRLDDNARPLCAAHHTYFTNNPEARRSLADQKVDLASEWTRLMKGATR